MLLQEMRILLFLLSIGLGLTACDSFTTDSEGEILEDPGKDEIAPQINSSFPEHDAVDVEVDSTVRFTFSELMNIDILENPFSIDLVTNINADTDTDTDTDTDNIVEFFSAGVVLYSGRTFGSEFQLSDERPRNIEYSVALGVGVDPVTNNKIDIDVTAIAVQHESGRFALNTEYTVQISEHVVDLADDPKTKAIVEGNSLGKNIELSFITEEGEWKDEAVLALIKEGESKGESELIAADQFEPELAFNDNGDVLAVWRQKNSNGANDTAGIWAGRYSPFVNAWVLSGDKVNDSAEDISAERIDDLTLEANAFAPKIAINKHGKAVSTWYQSPDGGARKSIWINVFDSSSDSEGVDVSHQWKGALTVGANQSGPDASSPEIGIDDEGNILVVWLEVEGGVKLLKAHYYSEADQKMLYNVEIDNTTVGKSFTINNALGGDARLPTLSYSSDGVAMLAWSQEESGIYQIYASRFDINSWSEPNKLNNSDLSSGQFSGGSNPKVAVDSNNDAFVIWQQNDGKRENIWLSRFAGGVWSNALQMEDDNIGDATDPFIVFGSENQAFATWVQAVKASGASRNAVVVKPFSLDAGWGAIVELSGGNEISKPTLGFDFEGNATAIWINDGNILRSRYSKLTSSWSNDPISSANINTAQSLDFAPLLKDGRFINVWTELKDGGFILVSSLFSD